MKVKTVDGQVFDAWLNVPENDRKVPAWVGQIGHAAETHTTFTTPDGTLLTVGAGDVLVNANGRVHAFNLRNAQRLFDIIEEGEEVDQGPQRVALPSSEIGVGRARQGMVSTNRGRLQPDDPLAAELPDQSTTGGTTTTSDRSAAAAEQDGEHPGESAGEGGPTEATATGGPGEGDDPAFGATGDGGEDGTETEDSNGSNGLGVEVPDEPVTPSRRKGRK